MLILDGWARRDASGATTPQRGIGNLRAEGALNRMPYWLSLLADLLQRCADDLARRRVRPVTG
ncbi:hypothetical protein [Actinomycetospora callitridis]|uniref:hypothetical protein n=1 Tax=Actinomycetospora callitridis TaxID=913944 RepID=UPI0023652E67|nr:hypothetical protein [Actinomycetospora callitridis]MDD7918274.1 hypothetical protein [Actinomycetospora callitridis]